MGTYISIKRTEERILRNFQLSSIQQRLRISSIHVFVLFMIFLNVIINEGKCQVNLNLHLDTCLAYIKLDKYNPPEISDDSIFYYLKQNEKDFSNGDVAIFLKNKFSNQYVKLHGGATDSDPLGISSIATGYLDLLASGHEFYNIKLPILKTNLGVYLGMKERKFLKIKHSQLRLSSDRSDIKVYEVNLYNGEFLCGKNHNVSSNYYAKYIFIHNRLYFFGFTLFGNNVTFD